MIWAYTPKRKISRDKKSSEYGSRREKKTGQAAQKMVGLFEGGLRGETAESARCSRSAALESYDCKRRPCLKREKPGTEEEEEELRYHTYQSLQLRVLSGEYIQRGK